MRFLAFGFVVLGLSVLDVVLAASETIHKVVPSDFFSKTNATEVRTKTMTLEGTQADLFEVDTTIADAKDQGLDLKSKDVADWMEIVVEKMNDTHCRQLDQGIQHMIRSNDTDGDKDQQKVNEALRDQCKKALDSTSNSNTLVVSVTVSLLASLATLATLF